MALAPTQVGSTEEAAAIRLVTAHRCGDRDAFAEIVRSHYPSLLATARHRLHNFEDAEDAVQETLVRALLALDRFGDTGDWRLGAWLNTILIHVCADMPSRRRPTAPLTDWLVDTRAEDAEDVTSDHVALAAVQRAIADLPESQRRAFELRLVDGRPYGEVAGALGITEVNARARVRRARAALQQALESASAVKGAWASVPLLLTAPVRSALRRAFTGAGDSARVAGSQAIVSGAASTGSSAASAASAIAGTPVETGIQLLNQVSATPLGQAVVASAAAAPAKGSVVLGIVASLATAGGLSAPAVISGSTAGNTTRPPAVFAATPAPPAAGTSGPAVQPVAPPPSSTSSSAPSTTTTTTVPATAAAPVQLKPPSWMTLAATATAYRIVAPSIAGSSSGTPSSSSSGSPGAPAGGPTSASAGSASAGSASAGGSGGAPGSSTASAGAPTTGAGSTGSAPSGGAPPPATGAPGTPVALPFGTCTGVTGFTGVGAPTTVPALSSSDLAAVLSTGSLDIATTAGSPSFAGTAIVKATAGTTAPVHVKVGTCLADGGSILAVDMTGSTGDEVQLVGSLVAAPFAATTGADTYLFRGDVTQIAGPIMVRGALPWGLSPVFVAEVQVRPAARTGTLTVVFGVPKPTRTATPAGGPPVSAGSTGSSTTSVTSPGTTPGAGVGTGPSGTPSSATSSAGTAGPASTGTSGAAS